MLLGLPTPTSGPAFLFGQPHAEQSEPGARIDQCPSHTLSGVDYEQAKQHLLDFLSANDGHLTADDVEADPELAANRELVSAAAHELAAEPNIITGEETDAREWFPYSYLTRS